MAAPRLVCHIGTYKTGSTAIQAFMRSNREALYSNGVAYPLFNGDPQNHTFLIQSLKRGDASGYDDCLAKLQYCIDHYDPHTVVLSSEHFWPLSPAHVDELFGRLIGMFSEVSIIIYLRHQRDLWVSLYAQQSKELAVSSRGAKWGTTDYLARDIVYHAIFYSRVLDPYRGLFGANSLNARIYERSRFPDQDVVKDFCVLCDLDVAAYPPYQKQLNDSLAWKSVEVSKALADLFGEGQRTKEAALIFRNGCTKMRQSGFHDWFGKAPCYLLPNEQKELIDFYSADNIILSSRYLNGEELPLSPMELVVCEQSLHDIPKDEIECFIDYFTSRSDLPSLPETSLRAILSV
jgi:hypothetical protein